MRGASPSTRLDLDCHVSCADGPFGELSDVVVDPGTRCLTHLIVQPHQRHEFARLVPIGSARVDAGSGAVSLDCTTAEINQLEPVRTSEYLRIGERPEEDPEADVGIEEAFELPPTQFLGVDALGAGMVDLDPHVTLTYDRVPKGMVELRRESDVTSSDGRHIGQVVGLVLDDQQRIAELVLQHGHLWSKREIAIPVHCIDRLRSDEVVLSVSHDEVTR